MKLLKQSLRESSKKGLGNLASSVFYYMKDGLERFDSDVNSLDLRVTIKKLGSLARRERTEASLDQGSKSIINSKRAELNARVNKISEEVSKQCQASLDSLESRKTKVREHTEQLTQVVREGEIAKSLITKKIYLARRGLGMVGVACK